jgi:hypothetical protein
MKGGAIIILFIFLSFTVSAQFKLDTTKWFPLFYVDGRFGADEGIGVAVGIKRSILFFNHQTYSKIADDTKSSSNFIGSGINPENTITSLSIAYGRYFFLHPIWRINAFIAPAFIKYITPVNFQYQGGGLWGDPYWTWG